MCSFLWNCSADIFVFISLSLSLCRRLRVYCLSLCVICFTVSLFFFSRYVSSLTDEPSDSSRIEIVHCEPQRVTPIDDRIERNGRLLDQLQLEKLRDVLPATLMLKIDQKNERWICLTPSVSLCVSVSVRLVTFSKLGHFADARISPERTSATVVCAPF